MNRIINLAAILFFAVLASCRPMKEADLIITNAKIYTVDRNFSIAEAMAVKNGKILATGSEDDILSTYDAPVVNDLSGLPVYPGFIDAHCHFYGYGTNLIGSADFTGTGSFDEVLELVKQHRKKYPDAYWIEGRGWDQNDWEVQEFPDNRELNRLFPDNPVILTRIDGHAALVNDKAMEIAGITSQTKVDGGEILLKNGKPTGILIDNAIDLVREKIPAPDARQVSHALLAAQEKCFAAGLTGVYDAGLDKQVIDVIDSLDKQERLKIRMYVMLSPTEENFRAFVDKGIYKTDRLDVRSIKLYADGALGSRGAKLIQDYSDDPGNNGLLLRTPESFREIIRMAYEKGFQVNTHAIGDSANRMVLTLYGEALKGKNDRRWRIEHAQVIAPGDFGLFAKYGIVPSVQPTHATSDMYWAGERLGPERIKGAYAYRRLLKQLGWIPLGTDFPVENINPLYTFYAAVARKDLKGRPEGGFQPENALTREEALRGMTVWAAKSGFEEDEKGSLEPGKFADFVVLDKDIMQIPENELPAVKVLKTVVGGEEVFGMPR